MTKAVGAAAILLASLFAALIHLREKRGEITRILSVRDRLLMLERLLADRQRPLGELFSALAEREAGEDGFYHLLCGKMSLLREKEFSTLWRESVGECFAPMGEEFCGALYPVGERLGGSELAGQLTALERAALELGELARARQERMREQRRMSVALSLCLGAFAVIILM